MEALMLSVCFVALGFGPQKLPEGTTPPIGINIGQKIPSFTVPDQFGHEVSSDMLKGPNGTVLLFFRSADW
ncbi:MAG: hypothetical protein ACREQ5_06800 [Candidatus Dormibacteria bacterium]